MKKIPKWAAWTAGAGVAYLLWQQTGQIRRDVFRASQQVSARTGGRVPALPRTVLPAQGSDPQFGVGAEIDFGGFRTGDFRDYNGNGIDDRDELTFAQSPSPSFGVGLPPL